MTSWIKHPNAKALVTEADGAYGLTPPTDTERLDWVEANAKEHHGDGEAEVAVQHHLGGIVGMEETGFYFRQWGAVPIDDEGYPDYSHRFYRSTRYETLREAIDAAIAAARASGSSDRE